MDAEKLIIRSKTPDGVVGFDQHGFAMFSEDQVDIERSHMYSSLQNTSQEYLSIWETYLANWQSSNANAPNKLRYLIRKGVPRTLRPVLWAKLLGCEQQQMTSSFSYLECVRALRSQMVELGISEYCFGPHRQAVLDDDHDDHDAQRQERETDKHRPAKMKHLVPLQILRQIVVDLERTFPTHRLFMGAKPEAKEGRASLFRLLSVYALYNPTVGYCQGMSYLVGMLLMVMNNEEDVFWAMVALFEKPKFLAGYFDKNLKRIQSHASLFHKLLGQRYPRVARHFDSLGVQPLMYVTPWFMCLYTSLPCWDTVLAIWDLIFMDGVTTIFRVGLSLIDVHQELIMTNTDLTKILPPLLHPNAEMVHHDILVPAIWKMNVEKWEIEAWQAIVAEEEEPLQLGMKRRHHAERTFGEVSQDNKRRKVEENPKAATSSSFFQRVVNIFTPRNQQENILQGASTRKDQDGRHDLKRRPRLQQKGPGAAMSMRHHTRSHSKDMAQASSGSETRIKQQTRSFQATSDEPRDITVGELGIPTRSRISTPGISQKTKTTSGDSSSGIVKDLGQGSTPWKGSIGANDVAFKGCRQSPRTAGRSKMFGRLHAKVFGAEEPQQQSKFSHPLEDVAMTSPERPWTPTKPRQSHDRGSARSPRKSLQMSRKSPAPTKTSGTLGKGSGKSPRQPQRNPPRISSKSQRPVSRSSWMSPYCKQYMVNPILQNLPKTPPPKTPRHLHNSKDIDLSPPRSTTPELDFTHVASPGRSTVDKENCLPETVSPSGRKRRAPSIESLESPSDGVLSVLGDHTSSAWTEMRSPLTECYSTLNNNIPSFKTPSHPMNLRTKQFTPGMYTCRTPRTEERHLQSWHNPMNMPSARKLVCRSAKAQHSFKTFHTPTALRQSKVLLDLHQSPCLPSPESEVELTTMGLASPTSTLNLSRMNLDD